MGRYVSNSRSPRVLTSAHLISHLPVTSSPPCSELALLPLPHYRNRVCVSHQAPSALLYRGPVLVAADWHLVVTLCFFAEREQRGGAESTAVRRDGRPTGQGSEADAAPARSEQSRLRQKSSLQDIRGRDVRHLRQVRGYPPDPVGGQAGHEGDGVRGVRGHLRCQGGGGPPERLQRLRPVSDRSLLPAG